MATTQLNVPLPAWLPSWLLAWHTAWHTALASELSSTGSALLALTPACLTTGRTLASGSIVVWSSMVEMYPWADGVNLDLEHFPKVTVQNQTTWQADLARMICELQTELHSAGLRLHSMDLGPHQPPWGVFNISALAPCVDYLLPMANCSPASHTVVGPTLPLDKFKSTMQYWSSIPSSQIMVGLPDCQRSAATSHAPIHDLHPCHRTAEQLFPVSDGTAT